ncbi:bacteriophage GP29 protein [Caballeronia choica]|uniref:Bacteriophage GP29 protein n=1 Tax=Caballeronia choica TaxID=326476 RepID=A0A158KFV3_9BURK|nr:PAAR domain-containing protein [Caballeronia choica]SAL80002.1 bacteriophage GP29 protein [Caballeronia choica]
MRKAAVRDGDPTTTSGFVIVCLSTITDDGKKIALSGEEATCGNCKGTYKIFGTGQGVSDKGRLIVVDGDSVLCPCGKNKVIVGSNSRIFLHTSRGSAAAISATESLGIASPAPDRLAEDDDVEDTYPVPVSDATVNPDCSYLDGSNARIDAPASLYKRTNNISVGPGKQTTFEFPGGGTATATRFDATINGHPVNIYVPTQNPAQGYGIPGEKEIAKALETVPPQQYKDLQRISINPAANSQDATWQKIYNDPTFSSAATASIDQGVAFYPWKGWSTFPQEYVDSTMSA